MLFATYTDLLTLDLRTILQVRMNLFHKSPATIILVIVNVVAFFFSYIQIGSFDEPQWSFHLLSQGAEFNPYTLNGQWYRIFTHMFLHGGIIHLLVNMYALYSVGMEVENEIGPVKFLWVYFLSGVAAALVSLYWTMFSIGVGASGAIFGLFGFSLVLNIVRTRREQQSLLPVFLNFALFLGINLYFAEAFKADTSAHLGGLACGIVIGVLSSLEREWFWRNRLAFAFIPFFIAVYFALPRYQVTYFNFFQSVLAAEDSARRIADHAGSDAYYVTAFKKNAVQWDSTLKLLDDHRYLPEALHRDTFMLRRYILLRKAEAVHRITMIERESYIYMDSLDVVRDSITHFNRIDYPLVMAVREKPIQDSTSAPSTLQQVRVLYNEDWEEISEPPFTYYRIGSRDSLGRWQGRLTDFYANGDVQMKGSYKNDERDGIFLYYSDHKTYTSAGRYNEDRSVGKWEIYHTNGKLYREEFYTDRYFMKNLWDSSGNRQVVDGRGKVVTRYVNGVVAEEGEYRDGYKEGYWYGRHANGDMYFEENYYHGRLTKGRSRTGEGATFIYDESSFYPLPEGGYEKLKSYLKAEAARMATGMKGNVRLSFRVTDKGKLTDFKVLRSVSAERDELAKRILQDGPQWIPAKEHGHKNTDGFSVAEIDFQ